MKLGQKMLGKKLFGEIMKRTFYGQFVAGPVSYHYANEYFGFRLRKKYVSCWIQDTVGITPTIARMHSFGVKSILDYSVEEDISQEEAEKREMEYGVIPPLLIQSVFLLLILNIFPAPVSLEWIRSEQSLRSQAWSRTSSLQVKQPSSEDYLSLYQM